jgi:hypothetical protein
VRRRSCLRRTGPGMGCICGATSVISSCELSSSAVSGLRPTLLVPNIVDVILGPLRGVQPPFPFWLASLLLAIDVKCHRNGEFPSKDEMGAR